MSSAECLNTSSWWRAGEFWGSLLVTRTLSLLNGRLNTGACIGPNVHTLGNKLFSVFLFGMFLESLCVSVEASAHHMLEVPALMSQSGSVATCSVDFDNSCTHCVSGTGTHASFPFAFNH